MEFYTLISVKLAHELNAKKTYLVGNLWSNRKHNTEAAQLIQSCEEVRVKKEFLQNNTNVSSYQKRKR